MMPDLAACTSPTSFAQSRGSARSRIRCSTPGFAAGAAAGSAVFFFFAPKNQFSLQTEQSADTLALKLTIVAVKHNQLADDVHTLKLMLSNFFQVMLSTA